jgi:hypothetical protein
MRCVRCLRRSFRKRNADTTLRSNVGSQRCACPLDPGPAYLGNSRAALRHQPLYSIHSCFADSATHVTHIPNSLRPPTHRHPVTERLIAYITLRLETTLRDRECRYARRFNNSVVVANIHRHNRYAYRVEPRGTARFSVSGMAVASDAAYSANLEIYPGSHLKRLATNRCCCERRRSARQF